MIAGGANVIAFWAVPLKLPAVLFAFFCAVLNQLDNLQPGPYFQFPSHKPPYNPPRKRKHKHHKSFEVDSIADKYLPTDAPDGTGQTVGLLEFDSFVQSDVSDFLALFGLPSAHISNLGQVHVNGGASPAPPNSRRTAPSGAVFFPPS